MIDVEQQKFDYGSLDADTRTFVQEKAQSIHVRLKRTAEDVIAIGQDLLAVQQVLKASNNEKNGTFLKWLSASFPLSRSTAFKFMSWAEKFGGTKIPEIGSTINVLAELYDSEDTIIDMVESGQIPPTIPAIREAKREILQDMASETFEDIQRRADDAIDNGTFRIEPDTSGYSEYKLSRKQVFDAIDAGIIDIEVEEENEEGQYVPSLPYPQFEERTEVDVKEKRDAHVMRVMGSSDSPEWYTPQSVIDLVLEMFGVVDTDPCSNSHDAPSIPAHVLYTKDDDGLSQEWTGKTYLNPPYGTEIGKWTSKLIQEYEYGDVDEAIALLPARIDTVWFQPLYAYLMCNVRGRIQFANSPYSAPFPCVIVYIGNNTEQFIEIFKSMGPIMRRVG